MGKYRIGLLVVGGQCSPLNIGEVTRRRHTGRKVGSEAGTGRVRSYIGTVQ